jgi:large repetitive protein
MVDARCMRNLYVLCCLSVLVACSNGRGSVDTEPPSGPAQGGFTVSGTVAGLEGDGLVLQLNGGSDLAVSNNGTFTFTAELADATAYSVAVLTQPTGPSQSCTIANAGGTIAAANVTNVEVTCTTGAFALRGTVTGLAGVGLVLRNNGGDDLPISANGAFGFPSPVASGAAYNVTVATQPSAPSQTCTVANGVGTVGSGDVTNITVNCATGTFAIGGTVSGLSGSGLVLRNNGGDDLTINGNGPFQFAGLLASGAAYNVTVRTHPTSPTQSCTVTNGSGTVGNASVSNIAIACMTNRFTIGGTASGLAGSGLVLQLNGANDLQVPAAGAFAFPVAVASGTPYVVTVRTQPSNPAQVCTISNGVGVVLSANVTNVGVSCTTNSFSIGGSVTGLQGDGLVLQKNGGDDLAIASNGSFTFQTDQASGTPYQVTVRTQPVNPSQTCTVANASGTVGSGNVRNVRVACSTNTFSVGGTVGGLQGSGLVVSNNGDDLPINADGSFTFPRELASGATYNVTIRTQPSNPTQACTVGNGSGTVGAADITSVAINCSTSDFTVGGTVGGLAGSGLVLQNNGGDNLTIGSDGSFTFPTAVPSGASYNVTVATQPSGPAQACTVTNGSGVVGGDNVTSISVSCVTTEFTVGGTVNGLTGSGLVLQNNGADNLAIASNGSFAFPTSLTSGTPYNVTVATHPANPDQICAVTSSVGVVSGADVTTVVVTCATPPL